MKFKDKIVGITLFLVIWFLLTVFKIVDSTFLPPPHQVFLELGRCLFSGEFLGDLGMTLARTMTAFALAGLSGIPAGLLIGINKRLYDYTSLLLDFFRSLPVTALIPLFIFSFGVTDLSRILVVYVAGFLVITVNTMFGTWNLEPLRIYSARLSGMSNGRMLRRVILPEILPQVFAGLRTALSICLVISIVVEILMGSNGLGTRIYNSQLSYDSSRMYGAIVLTGVTGLCLNKGFGFIEKKVIHWRQEWRREG